jgi:hypothetical protein
MRLRGLAARDCGQAALDAQTVEASGCQQLERVLIVCRGVGVARLVFVEETELAIGKRVIGMVLNDGEESFSAAA